MDFKTEKEKFTLYDTIQTIVSEYPVENDFILPDFCDDVARILKCYANVFVTDKKINADRLKIEGSMTIKILYIAEGGGLRSASNKIPFSKIFDVKIPQDQNYYIHTEITTDYINSRILNQRRIDIRGALTISVKISISREEEFLSDAFGCGIQLKKENLIATKIIGEVTKEFTVREDLELSKSDFSYRDIVMSRILAKVSDYKVISNKVIIKGNLNIFSTASDNGNRVEMIEHTIPISQIVDLEGVDDDDLCFIRYEILNSDISLVNEIDEKVIAATIQLSVTVRAHKNCKLNLIHDAYSTDYEVEIAAQSVETQKIASILNEEVPYKLNFQLPTDEIEKVSDTWAEIKMINIIPDGLRLLVKARLEITILGYNNAGGIVFIERNELIDYQYEINENFENILSELYLKPISASYSMDSSMSMEYRLQTSLEGCVYGNIRNTFISSIQPKTDKPKVKNKAVTLTIYYADPEEDIWGIAKKYNTSIEKIEDENGIEGSLVEKRMMLLIPSAE